MSFKTVGASTLNVSGMTVGGKLAVVGAAIFIGLVYIPIHLPVGATAEETFFGQATHSDVRNCQATHSDVWDCDATFEEVI